MKPNKVGRPRKSEQDKVKYQRVAIGHDAYAKLKSIAKQNNNTLVEVINELVKNL
jgi:hypothetical protein